MTVATARSLLYTPATRPDRIAKARTSGADAVIVDLEDAIPADAKEAARHGAAEGLDAAAAQPGVPVWVRINGPQAEADLDAVLRPGLAGIVVPKSEPALLEHVDGLLSRVTQPVPVIALIETAVGVLRAEQVARHPRVVRLAVGEADLAGELRITPDERRTELGGVRLQIVLASAAAGIAAPIGPVETHLDDAVRLADTTRTLARQGFRARTALHPRQLAAINEVFTPTPDELRRARDYVDRFESAAAGTAIGAAGEFIDRAVLRSALEVIERAELAR